MMKIQNIYPLFFDFSQWLALLWNVYMYKTTFNRFYYNSYFQIHAHLHFYLSTLQKLVFKILNDRSDALTWEWDYDWLTKCEMKHSKTVNIV